MAELTPDQLPEYCDRLGKECEKAKGKKERKSIFKIKNLTELINWREVRPNLNSDFLDSNAMTTPVSAENLPVPYSSQETQLVKDLLLCFLGSNSSYIQVEPLQNRTAIREFKLYKKLDIKLYGLGQKCLLVATYYSQICRFIEDNRLLNVGRVNQSLASALDHIMKEYRNLVEDLELMHENQGLILPELWFYIQDVIRTLGIINNLVMDLERLELRGGATLTYLHEMTCRFMYSPSERHLLKFLTKKAATPYMQSVSEWIFNGIIFDPFDEFMIIEKPRISAKDCYSSEYWEKRYQLRKSYIPSFLEPASNEIFKSGAYLNVIRESVVSNDKKLELANIEELKYSSQSSKYLEVIPKAYIHSSSFLLSHMLEEYQLLDRFTFMKRYFLVHQGDFVVQVLDTCDEELSKLLVDIIPSRLETLVDMAISRFESTVRDDLTIVLQPQDLSHQVSKILSVAATDEQVPKNVAVNKMLTGFESFTLNMNCRWPVSLIFNARVISCYQMLFRLLFYCKHIERLLSRVWILDQRLRKLPLAQMRQYSSAFALRHKMIYFIQSMQYYIMEESLEPNWIEFQLQLKRVISTSSTNYPSSGYTATNSSTKNKIHSIDDLVDIHKKFLDKCMSDCLLTNAVLFPILKELLSTCKNFVTFIIDARGTDSTEISDIQTFSKTIAKMDKLFEEQYVLLLRTIAELAPSDDRATYVFELLHRANFNYYFRLEKSKTDVLEPKTEE